MRAEALVRMEDPMRMAAQVRTAEATTRTTTLLILRVKMTMDATGVLRAEDVPLDLSGMWGLEDGDFCHPSACGEGLHIHPKPFL